MSVFVYPNAKRDIRRSIPIANRGRGDFGLPEDGTPSNRRSPHLFPNACSSSPDDPIRGIGHRIALPAESRCRCVPSGFAHTAAHLCATACRCQCFFQGYWRLCRTPWTRGDTDLRSEEHTSELQSRLHLVCRLLLEKKKPA